MTTLVGQSLEEVVATLGINPAVPLLRHPHPYQPDQAFSVFLDENEFLFFQGRLFSIEICNVAAARRIPGFQRPPSKRLETLVAWFTRQGLAWEVHNRYSGQHWIAIHVPAQYLLYEFEYTQRGFQLRLIRLETRPFQGLVPEVAAPLGGQGLARRVGVFAGVAGELRPKRKGRLEMPPDEIALLKAAIDTNDLPRVQELMTRNPALHAAPLGYGKNGPLTWVAECRVPRVPPNETRLAMARWMIEHGSDIHQGGDGPLMRAALDDSRLPMTELLLQLGADPNARWGGQYPILLAPCETLQPETLRLLIARGADPHVRSDRYGDGVGLLLGTYGRNAPGKHACLDVFAAAGWSFPDTAPLAVHRGRLDRLAALVAEDASLLHRRFTLTEFFPPELTDIGLHVAPLEGTTLLHLAVEYQDEAAVRWLIEHGADVNARAAESSDGFGGHTPLFHTTVTLGEKTDTLARLLLDHGADPHATATFRKQLFDMGDPDLERLVEYRNVTPITFARQFVEPAWINEPAIGAASPGGSSHGVP